jgi:predicted transcriptional regulator
MAREKSVSERKPFGFRLDSELVKSLKILAIEQNRAVNEVLEESLQDLVKKYRNGNGRRK